MTSITLDESATPTAGPRDIADTGVTVYPIALDGGIFGWASGVGDTARVLDRFFAAGGNLVSTADHYAGGRSEVMLGSWLKTVADRGSVIVATKVGKHPDAPGLSQRNVLRAVEASLARLDTDYIDFLSFDGDHPETPIEEGLEAVDRLIREGKVRFLSASGFSAPRLREIQALAEQAGYPRFRAIVSEYNLMQRAAYEDGLQELATRAGRATLARLPLAEGYLTGEFRTRDEIPQSVMYAGATKHIGRRGTRVLEALDVIAEETDSTPAKVALAWVLVKPGIAAAVVRAKDEHQLETALGALDVVLARHHVALLDKASAY